MTSKYRGDFTQTPDAETAIDYLIKKLDDIVELQTNTIRFTNHLESFKLRIEEIADQINYVVEVGEYISDDDPNPDYWMSDLESYLQRLNELTSDENIEYLKETMRPPRPHIPEDICDFDESSAIAAREELNRFAENLKKENN